MSRPDETPEARAERLIADARRHRRGVSASLRPWLARQEVRGSRDRPRYRLSGAELVDGECAGGAVLFDGRWQQWGFDLQRESWRLACCERGGVILARADARGRPVDVTTARFDCKGGLCPVCKRKKAARAGAIWRPVIEQAARDGARVRLWTLTHRTREEGPPALVLPHETVWWEGYVPWGGDWHNGIPSPPQQGESLFDAYDRLRTNLRKLRQSRASRDIVARQWGGYLMGVEWTGRRPSGSVPRWHAHCHLLTVSTAPPSEEEDEYILHRWAKLSGGLRKSQDVQEVRADSISEVIKYPFKPVSLTSAQRIAVLAYMRGLKPQQVGGYFHHNKREARSAPWSDWLALRGEEESTGLQRLHFRDINAQRDAPFEVYSGQEVDDRLHEFALPPAPGKKWRPWLDRPSNWRPLIAAMNPVDAALATRDSMPRNTNPSGDLL